MPLDNEYNRKIAKQYNDMNRAKVAYLDNNYLDVIPAPVGYDVNGYEPRRTVGSGVGVYKKGGCCGGNNPGLKKNVRMELNYGAGLRGDKISRRGLDTHNELTKEYQDLLYKDLMEGKGMAYGKKKHGCLLVSEKEAKGQAYGKKGKGGGEAFTMSANPDAEIYGGKKKSKSKNKRAEIVKKVMKEKGMKMIEASKFVKANNLY